MSQYPALSTLKHSFLSSFALRPLIPPIQARAGGYPWGDKGEKLPGLDLILSQEALRGLLVRRLSHRTHRRGGLTTARIRWLTGCWSLTHHPKPPAWEQSYPVPFRVQGWSHLARAGYDYTFVTQFKYYRMHVRHSFTVVEYCAYCYEMYNNTMQITSM